MRLLTFYFICVVLQATVLYNLAQGCQTHLHHRGPHQPLGCLQRNECNFNSLTIKEQLNLFRPFEGNLEADVGPGENEFDIPDLAHHSRFPIDFHIGIFINIEAELSMPFSSIWKQFEDTERSRGTTGKNKTCSVFNCEGLQSAPFSCLGLYSLEFWFQNIGHSEVTIFFRL